MEIRVQLYRAKLMVYIRQGLRSLSPPDLIFCQEIKGDGGSNVIACSTTVL